MNIIRIKFSNHEPVWQHLYETSTLVFKSVSEFSSDHTSRDAAFVLWNSLENFSLHNVCSLNPMRFKFYIALICFIWRRQIIVHVLDYRKFILRVLFWNVMKTLLFRFRNFECCNENFQITAVFKCPWSGLKIFIR